MFNNFNKGNCYLKARYKIRCQLFDSNGKFRLILIADRTFSVC